MNTTDVFAITDKLDAGVLEVMVNRLEARGRHPYFLKMLHEYLDAMRIDAAASVLDMGCGTGVAARAIAARQGFTGKVVGIDLSPHLAAAATRLAKETGAAGRLEFRTGDTRKLNIADAQFDVVVAHTLVSHVVNPLTVIKEAARVVKPGGKVAIFDGDYASLTFDQEDPVKGEKDDAAIIASLVTNPRVMRQMPRLLRAAGLKLTAVFPYVLAEVGKADFWASGVEAYRRFAAQSGQMSKEYADAWAARLVKDADEGIFFGASNFYTYLAKRV